jgi:hypothetical protein
VPLNHDADVSTLNGALGSNIGFCSVVGADSDTGGVATGATVLGLATFFLATFFADFLATGAGLAFTFLRAGFAALFAMVFALLDDFAFFFTTFFFATGRFDFPVGRFFALLFFLAIINFLLAVLRLLAVRVSLKKSAVICA